MKTKMLSKKIGYWAGVIVIGTVLGLALQFAKAWTEPTVAPPDQNVGAPINVGTVGQTKFGNFSSTDMISAATLGSIISVTSPKYCIGTDCITSWPGAGTSFWTASGNGNNIYNNNSGNVGIGTNNPSEKLDVNGNISLTKAQGAGV